ncbi:MAG: hypothetical protein V7646_224 [Pseudonocardia sp.]
MQYEAFVNTVGEPAGRPLRGAAPATSATLQVLPDRYSGGEHEDLSPMPVMPATTEGWPR